MTSESDLRPPIGLFRLSLVAIFVGIVTGFGAIAFRGLIGFIHNLLFLGHFSFFYDANAYTPPSPWGAFVILVPVLSALVVTLLVTKFAPEARGHGVPEVMDAVYYAEGRIRPIGAAVKSLASAVAIGRKPLAASHLAAQACSVVVVVASLRQNGHPDPVLVILKGQFRIF